MTKIGIISNKNNLDIAKEIISWAKYSIPKARFVLCNKNNEANSIIENANEIVKKINSKTITRAIAIDDWGICSFMYLSKFKNLMVAQLNNEYNAHMTMRHNNANVLTFGSKICTIDEMKNYIKAFYEDFYEGNRHVVRLDMISEILRKEKTK